MATDDNTIKATAFAYAEAGMRVIPLWAVDKDGVCLCYMGKDCKSQGKHPVSNGWQKSPRVKDDFMEAMFRNRNIGIATGKDSGIFVLDIDPDNEGLVTAKALSDKYGSFFNSTTRIKTGSGGYHLYYTLPDFELKNSASKIGQGIDVRGEGGQVVAPPSVSAKGAYTLDNAVEVGPAPEWLLEKLRPKPVNTKRAIVPQAAVEALGDAETARLRAYSEGAVANERRRLAELSVMGWERPWNATTFEVACNLIQLANAPWSHITVQSAEDIVLNETPEREAGFTDEVVRRTFNSAQTTIGDKVTPTPDPPSSAADFMFGPEVEEDPKGHGAEGTSTDGEVERECIIAIAGVPVDGDTLDPDLAKVRAADELIRKYHSGHINSEYVESNSDIRSLIALPESVEGDTTPVDDWISTAIRSGTPELFWEVLGYLVGGDYRLMTTILIKGCSEILCLLTDQIRPVVDNDSLGLMFGPELMLLGEADIRLEFAFLEPDFNPAEYLQAIIFKALAARSVVEKRGHFSSQATTEVSASGTPERKTTRGHRSRFGQSVNERGDGDEFFVEA